MVDVIVEDGGVSSSHDLDTTALIVKDVVVVKDASTIIKDENAWSTTVEDAVVADDWIGLFGDAQTCHSS